MARLGEIIDGKYEVLREVGRGGMSVVYLAMDKRLNKQWAIKEFRKDKDDASKQIALKALLDEANLMKKLDHPTLPRIVDIIDDNQNVYVVMDYIEGESLNKVLDAYGAQPQEAVIEWAKQLSDVLDYLHTQNPPVIYRDMKPANIMLKPDGTVRLIDFGIAREYKEGKDGDTEAIGTRGYAAPEQFGGKGQTDARTDIYSLGVTLYHLVTGKNPAEPPYEIYPIRHWNPSLSSGFEWLIQKCTQLNPNDRYQSCAEVTYVLENLPKFEGEYKKKQRSRINMFLAAVIMTAVLAVSCVACFVGANSMKKETFEYNMSLNTIQGYIDAMETEQDDPRPYVGLAELLDEQIAVITPGSRTADEQVPQITNTVTVGDLIAWFRNETVDNFNTQSPENYARIQFTLGFLLWEKYDGTDSEIISQSMQYFRNVLATAQSGNAGNTAGLTEKEFNLARIYYCVCFFQNNRNNFEEDAAGNKMTLGEIERFAGIDVDTFEKSAYLAFWNTNMEILGLVNDDDNGMTDTVKLETLKRLSYIMQENQKHFYDEGISADNISEFMTLFASALDHVSDAKEEHANLKSEIRDAINRQVIPAYEGLYKIDMEEIA